MENSSKKGLSRTQYATLFLKKSFKWLLLYQLWSIKQSPAALADDVFLVSYRTGKPTYFEKP
jgi:hypothetical protein